MPQRDYIAKKSPKRKKYKENNFIIIGLCILLLLTFGCILWLLQHQSPIAPSVPTVTSTKSELPSPPEKVWRYIRDFEDRVVPTTPNERALEKIAQSTDAQKKEQEKIEKLKEEKREIMAQFALETGANTESKLENKNDSANITKAENNIKKEKNVPPRDVEAKPVSSGKFGLQCGAFKNKAQAENLQARLSMAGFNAKINASVDWNRVVIGPIGDRTSAVLAQSNAKSVADCVIIGM